MRLIFIGTIACFLLLSSCRQQAENYNDLVSDSDILHDYMEKLSDVIVHDIFSPPVASRNYAYPSIAGYEVIRQGSGNLPTFAGRLKGLKSIPIPSEISKLSLELASIHAFYTVSKALIFS